MNVKEDKVNLTITVNGDAGRKELIALDAEYKKLNGTTKELSKSYNEYVKSFDKLKPMVFELKNQEKAVTTLRGELMNLTKGTVDYTAKEKEIAKAEKAYAKTEAGVNKLRARITELKPAQEEYINASTRLKEVDGRMTEIKNSISLSSKNAKELAQDMRALLAARQYILPGTEALKENDRAILAVRKSMRDLNTGLNENGGIVRFLKGEWSSFGSSLLAYVGIAAVASKVTGLVKSNADLSDSLADLKRNAQLTDEEVSNLYNDLNNADVRTSTATLAGIANESEKLGVAKESVADFALEVNKLKVVFGNDLGDAEAMTATLGKILNVFDGEINSDNISKLGNALVEVGNKGVASAPFLADYAQRVSGTAEAANLGLPAVLGFAAGMEESGQRVESSSTALQKLVVTIGQDVPKAAKIAGAKTKEEIESFSKLFAEKPQEAILQFAQGLVKNKSSFEEVASAFKDAGEEGTRVISVLNLLGIKSDFFRNKIDLAAASIDKTTGINEAFRIKNENLAAEVEKLGKVFTRWGTNESVTNFLRSALSNTRSFFEWIGRIPSMINENSAAFRVIAEAVVLYNVSLIAATVSSIANTTAEIARNVAYQVGFKFLLLKETATKAYALATGVATGQITLAAAAQRVWNAVLMQNPVGWVLGGLMALVEGIDLYRKNTAEAIQLEIEKYELSKKIVVTNDSIKKSLEGINDEISNFNKLSPQERQELTSKIELKLRDAKATLEQLKAEQQRIVEASSHASTWQTVGNILTSLGNASTFATNNSIDAFENGKKAGDKYTEGIESINKSISELTGKEKQLHDITNAYGDAMKIQTVTTDNYTEKLRLLRVALDAAAVGSDEYKKIAAEIAKVQSDLNKKTSSGGINNEDAIKDLQELQKQTAAIERQMLQDTMSAHQKEIDDVHKKYETLVKLAHGNVGAITKIKDLENKEVAAKEKEQQQIINDLENSLHFSRLSKDEQEIQSIRNKYQKQIDDFKGFNERIKELEAIRDAEIEQKQQEQAAKKLADRQSLEDRIYMLTIDSNSREVIEEANKWDELITQADQAGIDSTNLVKLKGDAIQALIKKQNSAEVAANSEKNKKVIESDKRRWEVAYQLSQNYFNGIGALFQIFGAKQSAMLEFQKMATLTQIAIDTASAISSVVSKNASTSATPVDYAIKVGAAIATVLVNIAKAKQLLSGAGAPTPPAMKSGGVLGGGQVLPGPDVSDDNLIVIDPETGTPVAKVKSGEVVLSTETYHNNPDAVNALLDTSMNKGGAAIHQDPLPGRALVNPPLARSTFNDFESDLPSGDGRALVNHGIPGMASGGIINAPFNKPRMIDMQQTQLAMQVSKFGLLSVAPSAGPSPADTERVAQEMAKILFHSIENSNGFLVNEMSAKFAANLRDQLKDLPIKAYLDWEHFKRTTKRIESIEEGSTVG